MAPPYPLLPGVRSGGSKGASHEAEAAAVVVGEDDGEVPLAEELVVASRRG